MIVDRRVAASPDSLRVLGGRDVSPEFRVTEMRSHGFVEERIRNAWRCVAFLARSSRAEGSR